LPDRSIVVAEDDRHFKRAEYAVDRPLEVADVFRRYRQAFGLTHAPSLSSGRLRVMSAVEVCRTAAETLRSIAADPKHLGAEIGFLAILHTWGQNLLHHPHLHCVVPGGGIAPDGAHWIASRPDFFLPVRVLSRLCCALRYWYNQRRHEQLGTCRRKDRRRQYASRHESPSGLLRP